MKKTFFLVPITLFFIFISVGMVSAASNSNLYVDVNLGSDLNDGSQNHPWSTINHAAEQVKPGETVLIADGTYHITENIHITTSGNQTHPVTFKGLGNGAIIDASGLDGLNFNGRDAIFIENSDYVVLENLEIKNAYRAGVRVSGSDHVTIKNVKSHDNGRWGIFSDFSNYLLIENCQCYGSKLEHGIYTSNSGDNPIIRGNIIHDNYACGIHMNGDISMGGDGVISQALVENNIIYSNGAGGGSGINCDGVKDSIIRNNLLYNNHASGISLYCIDGDAASNNNQVYFNTVIVASDGRWALNLKDGSSQNKIYNNILVNNNLNHGSITTDSIIGLESDYNILTTNSHPVTPDDENTYPSFSQWQVLGFDKHSKQTTITQVFTNPSGNDYTLKIGSSAVDFATPLYSCSTDIQGHQRPSGNGCDVGAYEQVNNLLQPSDMVYIGAFRLPDTPGGMGWEWAGVEMGALTYYPDGDSGGASDGFPGSLYGTGHDQLKYISEVSIPTPIISATKNPNDLNTASTLQGFKNVLGSKIQGMELPKVGLAYLEKQGNQSSDKIYYCFGQHIQDEERNPSHGWFELDLSNPQIAGDWKIDNKYNYLTTYYLFSISPEWADIYTPGMYLATGRFRDGGQGSQGPTIFAYGPWNQGNPPVSGTSLSSVTLLQYSSVTDPEQHVMDNYAHSDEWNGGAWLNSGNKSSVIFVGTKGLGYTWYGYSDGTEWPTSGQGSFPSVPNINPSFYGEELRGWWSDSFQAQVLFYDPDDLAAVAQGIMQPYEPQPYAVLNIDPYLFNLQDSQQKDRVGAVAYDSERGYLYVLEPLADGDKSIIHVWKIGAYSDTTPPTVTTINPTNNATGVSLTSPVTITFSENILAGANYAGIYLKNTSTGAMVTITKSISGNTLTINHTNPLKNNTPYQIYIPSGAVKDSTGNNLTMPYNSKFTTISADTTPPTVSTINPTNNATGVSLTSSVTITFSENIAAGANYTGIYLKNTSTGAIVTITKTINGNTLTINHTTPLKNNTPYQIYIPSGAVKDSTGNNLTMPYNSKFTTISADTTPPTITTISPANNTTGVSLTSPITINFSENIAAGANYTGIYLKNTSTGAIVTITKSISGNTLTIQQSTSLKTNTRYQVYIPSGAVKDTAGNNLFASYTSYFTTIEGSIDATAPTVIRTNPTSSATGISLTSPITITFSENVVAGSNYSGIYVKNLSTGKIVSITSKSIIGNILTIKQTYSRLNRNIYQVYLPAGAVKDSKGNILKTSYTFTFKTV
jgi:parallel beta-helix repeat protein